MVTRFSQHCIESHFFQTAGPFAAEGDRREKSYDVISANTERQRVVLRAPSALYLQVGYDFLSHYGIIDDAW